MNFNRKGQGGLEYLLLIGGAVLVAGIVIALISSIPANLSITGSLECRTKTSYASCVAANCRPLNSDWQNATQADFFICDSGTVTGSGMPAEEPGPSGTTPSGPGTTGEEPGTTPEGTAPSGTGTTTGEELGTSGTMPIDLTSATSIKKCQPISTGGTYVLGQSVSSTTGPCITISASNVILDCQNNIITGNGRGTGIQIRQQTQNVTVQNCEVSGFFTGITVDTLATHITINKNKIYGNSHEGIFVNNGALSDSNMFENTIINNEASLNGTGIYVYYSGNALISGNEANNNNGNGIAVAFSRNSTITGNTANSNGTNGILLTKNKASITLTDNKACDNNSQDIKCDGTHNGTKTNTANKFDGCSFEVMGNKCATTGNLEVKVIDSITGEPIEGATVDLNGGSAGGLVLKTDLLVKAIRLELTTNTGKVTIDRNGMIAVYEEGDIIAGLEGRGAYAGQEMTVKVAAIIQTGPAASYQARFELYDSSGNKVDQRTVDEGTYLNNVFVSGQSGAVYYQGDIVTGLIGTGAYAEQEMTVKVVGIVESSGQPYLMKFNLYDSQGYQVSANFAHAGQYLNEIFIDATENLELQTPVYVNRVFIEPTINKNGVELTVMRQEVTNSLGIALFEDLVPGTYTLALTKAGYNTRALTVRVDAGITTEIDVELTATCRIVCTSNAACNDNNAMTVDICLNPGTCSASCIHYIYDEIQVGNNAITYRDADSIKRNISFMVKLVDQPQSNPSEQTIPIDTVPFYAKCYKPSTGSFVDIDVYNGNRLNGLITLFKESGRNAITTDNGWVYIDTGLPKNVDLGGVQFTVIKALNLPTGKRGATLRADANCTFASEAFPVSGPKVNSLQVGGSSVISEIGPNGYETYSIYMDDSNTARGPNSMAIYFTKSGTLKDTYRYRPYYSSTSSPAVYLLLDYQKWQTNKGTMVSFFGTDEKEEGMANRYYYWPDKIEFGNDPADNALKIAHVDITEGPFPGRIGVMVDTATNQTLQMPQPMLSNYTGCVYYDSNQDVQYIKHLKCRTDISPQYGINFATTSYGSDLVVVPGGVATIKVAIK